MAKKWQHDIARSLPLWHNSAYFTYGKEGYKKFNLPNFLHLRIHRGTLSEFYVSMVGPSSRTEFDKKLWRNLQKPSYIKLLHEKYLEVGKRLLKTAKLTAKPEQLKFFFEIYGQANSLLDLTAAASKLLTNELAKLTSQNPNQPELFKYYAKPAKLLPIENLEKNIAASAKKAGRILTKAKLLHSKFCWVPVSFVGEPWPLQYFVDRLKNHQVVPIIPLRKPTNHISARTRYLFKL